MMRTKLLAFALLLFALALPAFGMTYKDTYPLACGQIWPAVKDTLGNPENYDVKKTDDTKMTASYHVKHKVHVTITGAILQRTNKVTLVPKGTGCEMQVVSNYSGFEHDDRADFKTRVDEALAKRKAADSSPQPATTSAPAK